jgi:hypothetical protein
MIISIIFMPEAWSPETHKSNEISWDGVFAEHGEAEASAFCANSTGAAASGSVEYFAKDRVGRVSSPHGNLHFTTLLVTVLALLREFVSTFRLVTVAVFWIVLPGEAVTWTTSFATAPEGLFRVNGSSVPTLQLTVFPLTEQVVPDVGVEHWGWPPERPQRRTAKDALTNLVPGCRESLMVTPLAALGPRFSTPMI